MVVPSWPWTTPPCTLLNPLSYAIKQAAAAILSQKMEVGAGRKLEETAQAIGIWAMASRLCYSRVYMVQMRCCLTVSRGHCRYWLGDGRLHCSTAHVVICSCSWAQPRLGADALLLAGAVWATGNVHVTLEACTFSDNQAFNDWGGAVYVRDNVILKVIRCKVLSNTSK